MVSNGGDVDDYLTPSKPYHCQISEAHFPNLPGRKKGTTHYQVELNCGWRGKERIVPPAGEKHAFEVDTWARRVTVCISPTGRSVRVFVDGVEVPKR